MVRAIRTASVKKYTMVIPSKKRAKPKAKKVIKIAAKKPIKKAAKKKPLKTLAKKPVKKLAKKPVKKLAKLAKKPVKKLAKKPVKKLAKKPVKKLAKKPVKKLAKKPAKKLAKNVNPIQLHCNKMGQSIKNLSQKKKTLETQFKKYKNKKNQISSILKSMRTYCGHNGQRISTLNKILRPFKPEKRIDYTKTKKFSSSRKSILGAQTKFRSFCNQLSNRQKELRSLGSNLQKDFGKFGNTCEKLYSDWHTFSRSHSGQGSPEMNGFLQQINQFQMWNSTNRIQY